MRYFFIIGCPRSGTTLLQQILCRHPNVVVPPETAFFTKLAPTDRVFRAHRARAIERDLEIELALPDAPGPGELTALYERMASRYAARTDRGGDLLFGEKTPDHLFHAERIARRIPDARFVLVYRDGRDVALSLDKVPWSPNDTLVNFGIWRRAARAQLRLTESAPAPIHPLRYEELTTEPERTVTAVAEFLGLPYDARMLDPDGVAAGIPEWELGWKSGAAGPLRPDRVAVWRREMPDPTRRLVERWGGRELAALGYEVSERRTLSSAHPTLWPTIARWGAWRAAGLLRVAGAGD